MYPLKSDAGASNPVPGILTVECRMIVKMKMASTGEL
jgi:hypothetical protein